MTGTIDLSDREVWLLVQVLYMATDQLSVKECQNLMDDKTQAELLELKDRLLEVEVNNSE